jgi:hypothetical protein
MDASSTYNDGWYYHVNEYGATIHLYDIGNQMVDIGFIGIILLCFSDSGLSGR